MYLCMPAAVCLDRRWLARRGGQVFRPPAQRANASMLSNVSRRSAPELFALAYAPGRMSQIPAIPSSAPKTSNELPVVLPAP
jgi:hypothetical protein